ncbi:MAG: hypothetical protein UR94_C0009G0020 [Parcubacteria group bacterium GW2011_GWA2_36_10]|nr:MAG: hypothetical protein UR94_C0009G0020 [Parcubacteria group bacterium GW2011_GWA2_36_10]
MTTSKVYSGDPSRVNVLDSNVCPTCQNQEAAKKLLGMKGAVEYDLCACGQHLMITGRQGCGSMAFTVAIEASEVPIDLVPASS